MTWTLRRMGAKRAQELLEHYGVEAREHIRLEDIAFDRGIEIVRGSLKGSAARLTRRGPFARIRLPAEQNAKDRFSIAHELGHHCMHADKLRACTDANMTDWHSDQTQEVEANAFAAELLMPTFLFKKRDEIWDVSMDAVKGLARDFETSLSSSAVRLVDLAEQPCSVAMVARSGVRWMFRNQKHFWPARLTRNSPLPKGSVAFNVVRDGFPTGDHSDLVRANVWCPNEHALHDVQFLEEVVAMPRLGLGLVLLTAASLPPKDGRHEKDEEDQDDNEVPWLKRW